MTERPLVHILWSGKDSIEEACRFIKEQHNIEIDLPANFHHAIFGHLNPDAKPGTAEFVDTEDGETLLHNIASIAGLELFDELITPVKEVGAKVIIVSPTPRIFIGH